MQKYSKPVSDRLIDSMPRVVRETYDLTPADVRLTALRLPPKLPNMAQFVPDLASCRISLGDLGVGLATVVYDARGVDDLPVNRLRELGREYSTHLEGAVQEVVAGMLDGAPTIGSASVLWTNVVFAVRVPAKTTLATRQWIAKQLTPDGSSYLEAPADGVISVGISSCSVTSEFDGAADALKRLAGVQHVSWATAIAYDAKLGADLQSLTPDLSKRSSKGLDKDARELLELYHGVRAFRTKYESVHPHLEPLDAVIWKRIEAEWRFTALMSALDDKLRFAQTMYEQTSGTILRRRADRLNDW